MKLVKLLWLLLFTFAVGAQAQFTYVTNNGTITITGYKCPSFNVAVTIPSTINGLPVTGIGDRAFQYCRQLSSVSIPDSVLNIGNYAFNDCVGLNNVKIGNSVTTIGYSAFQYCNQLTSVSIPNSVTSIGSRAFNDCYSLSSVIIPDSVTNIEFAAFVACTGLTNVTIGNSVTSIGASAFQACGGRLTSITIPDRVKSVGSLAFSGCFGLTNVTIGSGLTTIGDFAFDRCTYLTTFTVSVLNPAYSSLDGVLFNKSQTLLVMFPQGKAGNYTLPNSVTSIGTNAFYGCPGLTNVTIGNSVTNIGYQAFAFSNGLRSVTLGNSVANIEDLAFGGCSKLVALYIGGNAPGKLGNPLYFSFPTVYYLPGTSGWGSSYDGRPTALWSLPNPLILTSRPGFGFQTNLFGFTISWATNKAVVVDATTNPSNPVWTPVSTNALTGGSAYFTDPQWTNYPSRLYRLRAP